MYRLKIRFPKKRSRDKLRDGKPPNRWAGDLIERQGSHSYEASTAEMRAIQLRFYLGGFGKVKNLYRYQSVYRKAEASTVCSWSSEMHKRRVWAFCFGEAVTKGICIAGKVVWSSNFLGNENRGVWVAGMPEISK